MSKGSYIINMRRIELQIWLFYFSLGAISCWGPEVVFASIFRRPGNWQLLNIGLPLCVVGAYFVALRSKKRSPHEPSLARCMLVGVYASAPWLIGLENTFMGAGFRDMHKFSDWAVLLISSLVPIYTFVISTYDVSLFGLVVVTSFLIFAHNRWEKGSWTFRP